MTLIEITGGLEFLSLFSLKLICAFSSIDPGDARRDKMTS